MTTNTKQYDRYASMVKTQRKQQYQHRVRYTDPGTGQEMYTGLCRDLNDAMLKASFLSGIVVDDDDGKGGGE
jgi:hypothetical protein